MKPAVFLTYNSLPAHCCLVNHMGGRTGFSPPSVLNGPRYNEISKLVIIWIIHTRKLWLSCHSGFRESAQKHIWRKTNKQIAPGEEDWGRGSIESRSQGHPLWSGGVASPPFRHFKHHHGGCGLIICSWGGGGGASHPLWWWLKSLEGIERRGLCGIRGNYQWIFEVFHMDDSVSNCRFFICDHFVLNLHFFVLCLFLLHS